jgi:hypothetical protein
MAAARRAEPRLKIHLSAGLIAIESGPFRYRSS